MTFISKFFTVKTPSTDPVLQFGRFSDAYKSQEQLAYMDAALQFFSKEKFLDSFELLLQYLLEPSIQNVFWTKSNGKIQFTLYQGSKIIRGEATAIHLFASSAIARYEKPDVRWMRILLEENYNMTYSRFAFNENKEISIVFDNYMEEAAPRKVYEALRELSIRADKIDDILLSDFQLLRPVQNDHIIPLPELIKDVKCRFIRKKVEEVLKNIENPDPHFFTFRGSFMFMILASCYSIDYLVKPEGTLMKNIELCHLSYFNNHAEDLELKNSNLIQNFRKLASLDDNEIREELYDTRSTFGLELAAGVQGLLEILDAQWNDLQWFYDNSYLEIHRFICDYVVGFSQFSLSLPAGYKQLLHLYYEITEYTYFRELGFSLPYFKEGRLQKKVIIKEIQKITEESQKKGIHIPVDVSVLAFDSIPSFCQHYMLMLRLTLMNSL